MDKQALIKSSQEQILCYIINNKELYYKYSSVLHIGLFPDAEMSKIFVSFENIIKENKNVNAVTISQGTDIINSYIFVTTLLSKISYDGSFEEFLSVLVDNYKSTSILKIISQVPQKHLSGETPDNIVSFITNELIAIGNKNYKPIKLMSSHLKDMFDNIERNRNSDGLTGLGSGLTMYDRFSGGSHPSDLVVIAGNASMGKSSLMLTMAMNTATMFDNPVGIWSFEMNELQLVSRLASMASRINSKNILRGKLSDDEIMTLMNRVTPLTEAPIYVYDCKSTDLQDLCNSIRALYIQKGIKQAFIDYIQLITTTNKKTNRTEQLGEVARTLKNLAKELSINIVVLCQLNRENTRRPNKEPLMSDLRSSGEIEEAADIVMFPFRPSFYGIDTFEDDGSSTFNKAELIIAKGRSIGSTRIRLNFNPELTKFSDDGAYTEDNTTFCNEPPLSTLQPNEEFNKVIIKKSNDTDDEEGPF